MIPGFGGGIQQRKDLSAEEHADQGHDHRTEDQEGGHGADETGHFLLQSGAEILGNDDLGGTGEAHSDETEKGLHVAADGQAGQTGLAYHLTHHNHIHYIVEHLQQVGHKQREGEGQHSRQNFALCKIFGKLFCGGTTHGDTSILGQTGVGQIVPHLQ